MPSYTNTQAVEMLLRTVTNRINVGDADPNPGTNDFDISRANLEQIRMSSESVIENRLSRFYVVPLAMTSPSTVTLIEGIATKLAAYDVWAALHPAMTIDDLPAAVRDWKNDVKEMLNQIVPMGKEVPVQGRDIVLDGETLVVGAGDPATSNVYFTTKLPFGGSTG